ncbi:hypothetical protein [Thalassospira lucentensis]|uniref:hypothetical protein n=1 Tax=Thalassospira lucentensis TaxID=168935 RepID=UPI00142E10BD|nr:hypothetical protein [Thalassospira lucentensis]NIZ03953.1 hypothetical protein [Thalassospira lucentensis]
MKKTDNVQHFPTWQAPDGSPLSCVEKIKVLNDNFAELREIMQDAMEDALLMGCDEDQFRTVMQGLVDELHNPYGEASKTRADTSNKSDKQD